MNLLDKLERKIGRYAIPNLMLYIVIGTIVAYVLYLANPNYLSYIYLDPSLVAKGQVWRLFTFIFIPSNLSNPFFTAISLYFYYFIGKMLEARWGAFRFNVFYFTGMIFAILAAFILRVYGLPDYLNETLFLAFATLFPEMTVLIFFILPIKVKWLGWLSAVMLLVQFIAGPTWTNRFYILFSLANYLLFFGPQLYQIIKAMIRREKYYKKTNIYGSGARRPSPFGSRPSSPRGQSAGGKATHVAFHRCHICGKTELDDPNMQFRYCSKCGGQYEYCMDHLYNHEHIQ